MVADNGPLYTCDIPLKIQHELFLHCISDQFDVILMDKSFAFLSKTRTFLSDGKLLDSSISGRLKVFLEGCCWTFDLMLRLSSFNTYTR
jgi:hypothetical protein